MVAKRSMHLLSAVALFVAAAPAFPANTDGIARTASGHPDLSGTYDAATLTPLERPAKLADKPYLTLEEARELAKEESALAKAANKQADADREAPPEGGAAAVGFEDNPEAANRLGAGNVGGYNWFWVDRGKGAFTIDGKYPTSIIIDPANGRMPPMTPAAMQKRAARAAWFRPNDGTAWWLDQDGPGPYDGPESVSTSERCITGFTGAAPTFPSLYNNFKRIVQTDDTVMIEIEMVHDARVVRMSSQHPSPEMRYWLGDSIGRWDGDTLVIDTTNYLPTSALRGGSENMHVVERLTKQADGDVLYKFTVDDPTTWTAPWTGEYVWRASDNHLYEYACHEGNHAMAGILRGARLLEADAMKGTSSSASK